MRIAVVLGASLLASVAHGDPEEMPPVPSPGDARAPGWLVGLGYLSAPNPYAGDVQGANRLVPLIGYIGERLTWLGPHLSYELVHGRSTSASAVIEMRFAGIDEDVSEGPLQGLEARRPALEAGADATYGPLYGSARMDASGRHDGHELSLGLHDDWRILRDWQLEGRAGAVWQSRKLTSYYYGIDASEARPGLEAYEPGAALNYEASLKLSRQFGRQWFGFGSVTCTLLDDDITSSPIVAQDSEVGAFVGFAYRLRH